MIQCVYSTYDMKAKSFGHLLFFSNDDMARRGGMDLMRNPTGQSPIELYPEDFNFMRVGAFDTETGVLEPERVPVFVFNFGEFRLRPVNEVSAPESLEE